MRSVDYIFSLIAVLVLFSCKTTCPLPSCKIRKQHHHALNFKNTREFEKEQKLKEKERLEHEEAIAMREADSLANFDANQQAAKEVDPEHDLALQQEQELKSKKEDKNTGRKKKEKRKKNVDTEHIDEFSDFDEKGDLVADAGSSDGLDGYDPYGDELAEDDMDLADMELDTKEAKKELKELDKLTKDQEKEAQEAAKKERAEMKESDKVYHGSGGSTKLWWKRKRNPEVGEDYQEPERKDVEKNNEYHW